MNGEEVSMPLPEELVERILAMVPFPQIFKARALSKSWHARLSSIASHADDEKKLLAVSFQKRVCEWSYKWKTYSSVFLFEEFLVAYDRASKIWHKIPTLSLLPHRAAMMMKAHMSNNDIGISTSIAGPLLYMTSFDHDIIFVVNILTGSWKKVPALPFVNARPRQPRLVIIKEVYKLIRLYVDVGCAFAWVYDSKSGAWRSKRVEVPEVLKDFELGYHDVYLNGVLYAIIVQHQNGVRAVLAFDVKDETFNLLQMPTNGDILRQASSFFLSRLRLQIVACNGKVYIGAGSGLTKVVLLEADLVLQRWSKVIRGPPPALKARGMFENFASDGDCIFFDGFRNGPITTNGELLAYNVRKDEWSYLVMDQIVNESIGSFRVANFESSFQPGMNPFLEA